MRNDLNILITDDVHPALMEGLDAVKVQYTYAPDCLPENISNLMKAHNALLVRSKINVDASFLKMHPQLNLVVRAGAGMDNIDIEAASNLGVTCFNAGAGNKDAVAEQAMGMLLSLSANITKANNEVGKGVWDRVGNRGFEIGGKTVGIIGYGNAGSALAEKLQGFGCRVVAYDKYKQNYGSSLVEEVTLSVLMDVSDIISFHVPLTDETRGWIGNNWISTLRKSIVLLNLSRGGIMDTESVIKGLRNGKIKAFATDVLENESLTQLNNLEQKQLDELRTFSNVIITPHIGGWTVESYRKISEVLLQKVLDFAGINKGLKPKIDAEGHYVG